MAIPTYSDTLKKLQASSADESTSSTLRPQKTSLSGSGLRTGGVTNRGGGIRLRMPPAGYKWKSSMPSNTAGSGMGFMQPKGTINASGTMGLWSEAEERFLDKNEDPWKMAEQKQGMLDRNASTLAGSISKPSLTDDQTFQGLVQPAFIPNDPNDPRYAQRMPDNKKTKAQLDAEKLYGLKSEYGMNTQELATGEAKNKLTSFNANQKFDPARAQNWNPTANLTGDVMSEVMQNGVHEPPEFLKNMGVAGYGYIVNPHLSAEMIDNPKLIPTNPNTGEKLYSPYQFVYFNESGGLINQDEIAAKVKGSQGLSSPAGGVFTPASSADVGRILSK